MGFAQNWLPYTCGWLSGRCFKVAMVLVAFFPGLSDAKPKTSLKK